MGLKLFRITGHSSLLDTRSALAWQQRSMPTGRTPLFLVVVVSAWLATVGNWALWRAMARLNLLNTATDYMFAAALGLMIFGSLSLVCALFAWRPSVKPLLSALAVAAALGLFAMLNLSENSVVTRQSVAALWPQIVNFKGLLSLAAVLLVVAGFPIFWIYRQAVQPLAWGQQLQRNFGFMMACAVLTGGVLAVSLRAVESAARSQLPLRQLINPFGLL